MHKCNVCGKDWGKEEMEEKPTCFGKYYEHTEDEDEDWSCINCEFENECKHIQSL